MIGSLEHAGLVRRESRDADHLRLLRSHEGSSESPIGRRRVVEGRNGVLVTRMALRLRLESLGLERLRRGKGMSIPRSIGRDQLSGRNAKRREGRNPVHTGRLLGKVISRGTHRSTKSLVSSKGLISRISTDERGRNHGLASLLTLLGDKINRIRRAKRRRHESSVLARLTASGQPTSILDSSLLLVGASVRAARQMLRVNAPLPTGKAVEHSSVRYVHDLGGITVHGILRGRRGSSEGASRSGEVAHGEGRERRRCNTGRSRRQLIAMGCVLLLRRNYDWRID
jgi:hypothetical protein